MTTTKNYLGLSNISKHGEDFVYGRNPQLTHSSLLKLTKILPKAGDVVLCKPIEFNGYMPFCYIHAIILPPFNEFHNDVDTTISFSYVLADGTVDDKKHLVSEPNAWFFKAPIAATVVVKTMVSFREMDFDGDVMG